MNTITITKAAAWLAIVAGVAVAILGFLGPLGVWVGAWDFRLAFSLLRSAHAAAPWVAGIALAIALTVLIVGSRKKRKSLVKLALVAVAAAGLSSLSYFIPETFRPPQGKATLPSTTSPPIRTILPISVRYCRGAPTPPILRSTAGRPI